MRILTKVQFLCLALSLGWPLVGHSQPAEAQRSEYRKVLTAVANSVQKNHYSPQPFNDELSEKWWRKFLETIDPLKQFFVQSDLAAFKKFRTALDEELRGEKNLEFLPAVAAKYKQRIGEAMNEYNSLLQQPLHFEKEEFIHPDGSSLDDFAKNAQALTESRRKYVKYLVLQKLLQLQDPNKTTEALESTAREKVFVKLEKMIKVKSADPQLEKLFTIYLNCFTHLMDPHTTWLSAAEAKKFRDRMSNKMAGIGVALAEDDEGAKVMRVEASGSAAAQGLELNDVITRLGEGTTGELTELTGYSSAEIANMVRGEKGSSLRVEVKKPGGQLLTVSLQRAELDPQENAVKALILQRENRKTGYITFPVFYQDQDPFGPQVAADVAHAIEQLKEQNVDAILFDLRKNGGGSLQEVTRMVSMLIKAGPVVQIRGRDGIPVERSSLDVMSSFGANAFVQQLYDGPLAVLVDEFSASASEIFAAAIQDYKRGVIIGSTSTHGKGTVQRGEILEGGSSGTINLTFSQFYRVNGSSTQQKGVEPDIVLPDLNECVKSREKEMAASLQWDMVAPASFETWNGKLDIPFLQDFALNRIKNDTAFAVTKENSARLCAQTRDIPLQLEAYKKMMHQQAVMSAANARALKLPPGKELTVQLLYPLRNETWLNNIRQDIYIEQSIAITAEMCR